MILIIDDTKFLRKTTTTEDAFQLQSDKYSLQEWSQKWLITLHQQKSHVLTVGKFYKKTHTDNFWRIHLGKAKERKCNG